MVWVSWEETIPGNKRAATISPAAARGLIARGAQIANARDHPEHRRVRNKPVPLVRAWVAGGMNSGDGFVISVEINNQ